MADRTAFDLCRDWGFPTRAEMCLWKENAHILRDSVNYLASLGCRSLKTNPVADTGVWHEGGVTLHGANEVVTEILAQTGFDSILHVIDGNEM